MATSAADATSPGTGLLTPEAARSVSDGGSTSLDPSPPDVPRPDVHRIRDLRGRSRWGAVAVVLALLVPIGLAFSWAAPTWLPQNDNALIELRALDVGTSRSPLTGQPSSGDHYGDGKLVFHPGPIEFYLLAVPVRVLGGGLGMIITATAITAASILIAAWAMFRQLGPRGGVIGALVLSALMFTTGEASLVDPVSSSIARYPLLCTAVLAWCLLCRDWRLLPLTVVVGSFAFQQHLGVSPAAFVLLLGGLAGVVATWRLAAGRDREGIKRFCLISLGIGLVMWAPVLVEQAIHRPGNLVNTIAYAGDSSRATMGISGAARQMVHAVGLPPVVLRADLSGWTLNISPSVLESASAVAVAAVLTFAALRLRRTQPRFSRLVATSWLLVPAGIISGSNVPDGIETGRLVLYHWVLVLGFLVAVASLWLLARAMDGVLARYRWQPPTGTSIAAVAASVALIAGLGVTGTRLDRDSNQWRAARWSVPRGTIDHLADEILDQRSALKEPVLVRQVGGAYFDGLGLALTVQLAERGLDVAFSESSRSFVNDDYLVDPDKVGSTLVLAVDPGAPPSVAGRFLASADPAPSFDRAAYEKLVKQASASPEVILGPELERTIDKRLGDGADLHTLSLRDFRGNPARFLSNKRWIDIFADSPPESPKLDAAALRRVRDTFPDAAAGELTAIHMSVYLAPPTPRSGSRTASP